MQTLLFQPPIPPPSVEILIGAEENALLKFCHGKRIAILADRAIAETHGKGVQKILGGELFSVEGGEQAKTRETKAKLENQLLEKRFGRGTLIVACGGGGLCDLAAFVASTYMRGVPLILIPTTLLAMVDAAVGGKTGVNTPLGKNLIGSFYHPQAVFINPDYLATLPQLEWKNGLAEILKYGLIFDASIWNFCKTHVDDWQSRKVIESLISSSLQVLIQIVERDPLETTGYRRMLNFGHTVAHALEQISEYTIPHGQAVAFGCVAESELSMRCGYLSKDAFEEIKALYKKFEFPLEWPSSFAKEPFFDAMRRDKKNRGDEIRFVLIDRIGHCLPFDGEYCRPISLCDLNQWLQNA